MQYHVLPTDRVGVIGIGGLGHLALHSSISGAAEVYAFSSNSSKRDEVLSMGADHVINSRNTAELESVKGKLDFLLSTVSAKLDWNAMLSTLAPKGKLHFVGIVLDADSGHGLVPHPGSKEHLRNTARQPGNDSDNAGLLLAP